MPPIIEVPKGYDAIKVVQLYIGNEPVMVIGQNSSEEHADVLEGILKRLHIKYQTFEKNKRQVPELKGDGYRVCGMGSVIRSGNELYYGLDSFVYNIGIDKEHLLKCIALIKENFEFFLDKKPLSRDS